MTGIKRIAIMLFSLVALVAAGGVTAQQASSVMLGVYERMAVLDHIDFAARRVIIGGNSYNLSTEMKWYGLEPEMRPEKQLDRFYKKRVGYALTWDTGEPTVSAIWVPLE